MGSTAVGLTGGLAAGKTTALQMFRDLGARILAADEVVSRLYGQPDVVGALREAFGEGIVGPDARVDRTSLGRLVARDGGAMSCLEQIVHPLVGREIRAFLAGASPGEVLVCEVPLLFQSGLEDLFDLVVTIEAGDDVRRRRRRDRGGPDIQDDLDRLQLSSEERMKKSDLSFVNEGSLDELRAFVAAAYEVSLAQAVRRTRDPRPARRIEGSS